MKIATPKVYVKFVGEEAVKARLVMMGEKVLFETGDVYLMDYNKAKSLCHGKKFICVNPAELTQEELKHANKFEEDLAKHAKKVEAEMEADLQVNIDREAERLAEELQENDTEVVEEDLPEVSDEEAKPLEKPKKKGKK